MPAASVGPRVNHGDRRVVLALLPGVTPSVMGSARVAGSAPRVLPGDDCPVCGTVLEATAMTLPATQRTGLTG